MISFPLVALAAVVAVRANSGQTPLSPSVPAAHRPGAPVNTDYVHLFNTEEQLPFAPNQWTRASWNGLVSFGHAPPLRCWGEEQDIPYDIAVIGKSQIYMRLIFVHMLPAGAPFDTATSFRPGHVVSDSLCNMPFDTATVHVLVRTVFGRARDASGSTASTCPGRRVSRTSSRWSIAATSVSVVLPQPGGKPLMITSSDGLCGQQGCSPSAGAC
jgi:hypothetical protein